MALATVSGCKNTSELQYECATCTGSKYCNACKNCKYCKHCSQDGGACGVCN